MKSPIETAVEQAYGKAFPNQAIDIATIIGLITTIFGFIQNCRGGAGAAAQSMKSRDIHSRIAIRRAIDREHPDMSRRQRRELFRELTAQLASASEADIDAVVNEAHQGVDDMVHSGGTDLGFIP